MRESTRCAICDRVEVALSNSPYNNIVSELMPIIKNAVFNKEVDSMDELDKHVEQKYQEAEGRSQEDILYNILDAVIKSVDSLHERVATLEKMNIMDAPDRPDRAATQVPLPEKEEGVGENPVPQEAPAPIEGQEAEEPEEESEGEEATEEVEEEPGDDVKKNIDRAEALEGKAYAVGKKIGEIEGIKKAVMQSDVTTPRPPTAGVTEADRAGQSAEAPSVRDDDLRKMSFSELNRKLKSQGVQ